MTRHISRALALVAAIAMATVSGCARARVAPVAVPTQLPVFVGKLRAPSEQLPVAVAPAAPPPPALRIVPSTWVFAPGEDGAQLIAEERSERGARRDFTAAATWEVEPAGIVTIDAGGYVRPVGAGEATVRARHGDQAATATVQVEATERGWDFGADVVPVLTRSGCNTGGCHGRADGQNGFHLSLFGYDPAGDYRSVTREVLGRRIDRLAPGESLILAKATGRIRTPGGPGSRRTGPSIERCWPGSRRGAGECGEDAWCAGQARGRARRSPARRARAAPVAGRRPLCRRPRARRDAARLVPRGRRLGRVDRRPGPGSLAPPRRDRPDRALPVAGGQHPAGQPDQSRPEVRLRRSSPAKLHR